ncbi:MAG: hypothetical protein KDK28_08515 [Maritimibacter sp.]|nr:hypothetical protein [Maritimibacter sp.]
MAKLKAYYAVDFNKFDLNYYKDHFASQRVVENSTDKTNAGSDDRYTIWTDNNDNWAVAFHGRKFDYDGLKYATKGTVEAFSEWFYNTDPDVDAGESFGRTRKYLLSGIEENLEDFIDALKTNTKSDDRGLLQSLLSGNDRLIFSGENDRGFGYGGNDLMKGRGGNDRLFGLAGDDTLKGQGDNDKLKGGSGDDVVLGGKGDDDLKGNNGADVLKGGQGNDRMNGGDGDDFLRGDLGNDTMKGGAGADTFEFRTGHGADVIGDWESADTINLRGLSEVTGWTDLVNNHMSQVGGDVVIDGLNGDTLTLLSTSMGSLNESDFDFGS